MLRTRRCVAFRTLMSRTIASEDSKSTRPRKEMALLFHESLHKAVMMFNPVYRMEVTGSWNRTYSEVALSKVWYLVDALAKLSSVLMAQSMPM